MFPNRSSIHSHERRLQSAKLDARMARQHLRQAVRHAAVSPRTLLTGISLGFGVGRKLVSKGSKRTKKGSKVLSLLYLLPLLRFR